MTANQNVLYTRLLPFEMIVTMTSDFDFITHNLFHQPTLTENDIAERLHMEPFYEGATYAR